MRDLLITTFILLALDIVYLKLSASHFDSVVKSIQGKGLTLKMIPAILAYITIVLSLYYLIIRENRKIIDAMILGWSTYFIFDFTNKAIFDNWDWKSVVMDGTWGGFLYGLTTYLVYKLR